MRILYMGNNWLGWQALKWLREGGEELAGLAIHPPEKQKFTREMRQVAGISDEFIFHGDQLHKEDTFQQVREVEADIAVSVLFDYILKPDFISLFPEGVINLHPAYLPYNKGQYPNVWSIVENTPAGTTLHYIDEKIDTGDIIAQRRVEKEPVDTGKTLYEKLERASLDLFKEVWPGIKAGNVQPLPQKEEEGTYHRTQDVEQIDHIDLDEKYTARTLIDILRARTFPPYEGAYFEEDGNRIYLRLELEYGD